MTSSSANNSVFVAGCPLQVATGEHPLTAIVEPERVAVVSLPDGALLAEIGLSDEAEGVDVAWLGSPPRLVVVSRLADHTLLHLLDVGERGGQGAAAGGDRGGPEEDRGGVRLCAEKRVDASLRLIAVNGNYGLLAGTTSQASSTAILTRSEDNLAIHPVPARAVPSAAGALGSQIVVAFPSVLELWDPVDRVAKRRLKLPRPTQIRAIGGSDRQIWLTTTPDPQRLEVLPLVNRGQPLAHELPEPIGSVASHPKLDVVVCAGADTGRLYVVDLDGRVPIRELSSELFGGRPMAMSMVGGRLTAIVAVAGDRPPRLIGLDGSPIREWPAPPPPPVVRLEPQMPQVPYIGPPSTTRAPAAQLSTGGQIGVAAHAGQGHAGQGHAGQGHAGHSSPAITPPPVAAKPAPTPPAQATTTTTAAAKPGAAAATATVYDSKLGQSVAAPPLSDDPLPRGTILGTATSITRTPRPGTQNEASAAPPGTGPSTSISTSTSTSAATSTATSTAQMIDRLQSWRDREAPSLPPAAAPSMETDTPPVAAPPPPPSRSASLNASGTAVVVHPPLPAALPVVPPVVPPVDDDGDDHHEEGEGAEEDDDHDEEDEADESDDDMDESDDDMDESDDDADERDDDMDERDDVSPKPAPWQPPEVMSREELATRLDAIGRMKVPQILDTWASVQPATQARVRFETGLASARALGALVAADWRGALADWTRALARKPNASASEILSLPLSGLMRTALERLGLSELHAPMLNFLYGSRLIGRDAVSPAEVVVAFADSRLPAERWREALGAGEVAASGAARSKGSTLRLSGALRRFLDEQPPKHGVIVTESGAHHRPRPARAQLPAVFALDTLVGPPHLLAKTLSWEVGSSILMVQRPLVSERQLRSAALEGRLRDALAVIPYPWLAGLPADVAAIYLAPTSEIAAGTGLPLLALHR